MTMKKQLPVSLLPKEYSWGFRYLLFQLVFLGPLLSFILPLLWHNVTNSYANAIYYLINFIVVICIFRCFLWKSLKYSASHWLKTLIVAFIGLVVYLGINILLNHLIYHIMPTHENINDAGIVATRKDNPWLTAIGTIILVPLAEETLHRGLIFGMVHQKSKVWAYVVSTLAFCAIHVMGYVGQRPPVELLVSFVQYIPAGIILALAYESSGSIFAPILMHITINLLAFLTLR